MDRLQLYLVGWLLAEISVVVILGERLHDVLQRGLGGVLQADDVLGVAQDLAPVRLVNLLPDLVLHTRLDPLAAEEVHRDQEVEQVGQRHQDCKS